MTKFTRATAMAVITGAMGAAAVVGVIAATPSGLPQADAAPTTAPAMPTAATFIADVPGPAGETVTMAISTSGDKVMAYATNGTDDDAYFFGAQRDGHMHLMSVYGDELTASFDGTAIAGEVTMNEDSSAPIDFSAARVEEPAGIYTAAVGTTRATYIVRANRSAVGVMDNSAPGDHKVTDAIMADEKAFKDSVRQMRLDRQMQQAPALDTDTMTTDMSGQKIKAVRVTGDMSF